MEATAPSVVGHRTHRLDADGKITGRARYASDFAPQGVLHGRVVRSDRGSALIIRIDVSAALELPGVEAVITGERCNGRFGEILKDQLVFSTDRVRCAGEPIAAVAAELPEIADLATRLIEIEYEDLPGVFDPVSALAEEAPLVHDDVASIAGPDGLLRWGNVCSQVFLRRGSTADAFAQAAHVIEGTYSAHSVHQAPMEPRAAIAEFDGSGRLIVHSSTQHPFGVRQQLVEALGLAHGDVRVIAETLGGGFGSKLEASVEMYAALLAKETGRPVRILNTREEDLSSGNPRHPMLIHLRSAVAEDGTILGREARIIMDSGAYAIGSPLLTSVAALLAPGPYRIPNLQIEALAVYTHNPPFGSYRGPTGPQMIFAVESHMDAIARELGLDPLEMRLRNLLEEGDVGPSGQPLSGVSARATLTRAAEAIQWGQSSEPINERHARGKGLACSWWLTTAGSAGCTVQMNDDGTAVVHSGASEIGTGAVMAGIAQVVAEELDVSIDNVRMVWGDTDATPMDAGAQGSRTLFNMGRAAQRAAQAARQQLLERAADLLEVAEADLEVADGLVSVRGVPGRSLSYAELMAGQMWSTEPVIGHGTFLAEPTPYEPTSLEGSLLPVFNSPSFHCHAAEVEVDLDTGLTKVLDFVVAQDAGFAINPTYVEGQMQGGAVQGIGYALTEELVIEDGRILNPNLALYKLPTAKDVPRIRTEIVEFASTQGPYGAKGVGEPPVTVPPAAIANAVTAATGVAIRTMPLTPERVYRAIKEGSEAMAPTVDLSILSRPAAGTTGLR
jgi:CO/xanthine dehydrogenase Mo-binding subunit